LFLIVLSDDVPADLARERARNLIRLRLRAAGTEAATHLGDITI
jgi:hypothetical protein